MAGIFPSLSGAGCLLHPALFLSYLVLSQTFTMLFRRAHQMLATLQGSCVVADDEVMHSGKKKNEWRCR